MSKVAFIGLGIMGYPMAGHIRTKGGHDLTVYNRTLGKAQAWVAEYGGQLAPTPAEAAKDADFVFCCVGNDEDLRAGHSGEQGAFAGLKPGAIFVDNTTASANIARELYDAAARPRRAFSRCAGFRRPGRRAKTACSPSWSAAIRSLSPRPSR